MTNEDKEDPANPARSGPPSGRWSGYLKCDLSKPEDTTQEREKSQESCFARLTSNLQKLRVWLEILTLLVVGFYACEARQANELTRMAMAFNERPVLNSTRDEPIIFDDRERRLTANGLITDTGKSPTPFFWAAKIAYSPKKMTGLWESSKPERRLIFPDANHSITAKSDPMDTNLGNAIVDGHITSGWLYANIWLWYGNYKTFLCSEYRLPNLAETYPCSDPNSNYAD